MTALLSGPNYKLDQQSVFMTALLSGPHYKLVTISTGNTCFHSNWSGVSQGSVSLLNYFPACATL